MNRKLPNSLWRSSPISILARLGMKKIIYGLLIFVTCISQNCCCQNLLSVKNKWVQPNVCESDDLLIFDFINQCAVKPSGKKTKLMVTKSKLGLGGTESVLVQKIVIDNDRLNVFTTIPKGGKLSFIRKKVLQNLRPVDSATLVNNIWHISSNKNDFYFEFFPNGRYAFTAINPQKSDTVANVYSWSMYRVDSLQLIITRDISCNRYFIRNFSGDSMEANSFQGDSVKRLIFERIINEKKFSKNAFTGKWRMTKIDGERHRPLLETIEFQNNLVIFSYDNPTRPASEWFLDYLGNLLVTSYQDEFKSIFIKRVTSNQMILQHNNVTYYYERVKE
jgi:hypothetical protein